MPGHVEFAAPAAVAWRRNRATAARSPRGRVSRSAGRLMTRRSVAPGARTGPAAHQFLGPGHREDEEPARDQGMRPGRDPYRVRAGDLAPVDPAQFTQLNVTLGEDGPGDWDRLIRVLAAPGWAAPGWAAPGWAAPGWAAPGWAAPGWGCSGVGRPGAAVSERAARSTGAATGVPPASAPRSAGPATRRIRIAAGVVPGRKQAMTEVAAASANTGAAGLDQVDRLAAERPQQQLPDELGRSSRPATRPR